MSHFPVLPLEDSAIKCDPECVILTATYQSALGKIRAVMTGILLQCASENQLTEDELSAENCQH